MKTEKLADYKLSIRLKNFGYIAPCFGYYDADEKLTTMGDGILNEKKRFMTSDEGMVFNQRFINAKAKNFAAAPFLDDVIDWMLEDHNIIVETPSKYSFDGGSSVSWGIKIFNRFGRTYVDSIAENDDLLIFETKIEALNIAVIHALDIIKEK